MHSALLRTSIALAVLVLAACGAPRDGDPETTGEVTGGAETGGGETTEADATETGAAGTDADGEVAPDEGAALPSSFEPAHGEEAVGVYFVRGDDPQAGAVRAALSEAGVSAGTGELSCDQGSAEALSLPGETIVVSAAFRTREDADAFVAAWGSPVLGVAAFTAYCRD